MDAEQELVYGWLGLNPTLLLDPVPAADNLVVRVVRPGEDAEAVLEEARQQLAASGPRRRRRGRGANGASSPAPANGHGASAERDTATLPVTVEITPLPVETFPTVPVLPDSGLELGVASAEPAAEASNGRRVRSRRRNDAPAVGAAAVAVMPAVEEPAANAEAAEDDTGEPRRRRRRSSATE
jgi:ribonuclease E